MTYRLHPGALDDLEEATVFYFREDPLLESRFAECIDEAIEQVVQRRTAWPLIEGAVRRYVAKVFPYSLLYSIETDNILIVAVAHQSRDPDIGRSD
jgi:toxin ParE1/3/4